MNRTAGSTITGQAMLNIWSFVLASPTLSSGGEFRSKTVELEHILLKPLFNFYIAGQNDV